MQVVADRPKLTWRRETWWSSSDEVAAVAPDGHLPVELEALAGQGPLAEDDGDQPPENISAAEAQGNGLHDDRDPGMSFRASARPARRRSSATREVAAPAEAVAMARSFLLGWHDRFTRFDPDSELSRLNADPARRRPGQRRHGAASPKRWSRRAADGRARGRHTARARSRRAATARILDPSLPLACALELAPPRRPAGPGADASLGARSAVDRARGTVTRPAGVRLDSGGLAKGLAADLLADALGAHASFAMKPPETCAWAAAERISRPVRVASPFDARRCTPSPWRRRRRHQRDRPPQLAGPRRHARRTTCSTRRRASRRSRAWCRRPRSRRPRSRPRRARKRQCSAARRAAAPGFHGGVLVFEDASHRCSEPSVGTARA